MAKVLPIGMSVIFTSERLTPMRNFTKMLQREVYRDALVPLTNNRIPRPWERAPVAAHAARLQGQKIMKRPEIRSRPLDDKENAAQYELESEGLGARKRVRRGIEENMAEPRWRKRSAEDLVAGKGIEENMAEEGEGDMQQYIPRKRTNMDRVITPRKQILRQTTLTAQLQTEVLLKSAPAEIEKSPRRRKSMRKSIRKSVGNLMTQNIREFGSLEDITSENVEAENLLAVKTYQEEPEESRSEQQALDGAMVQVMNDEPVSPILSPILETDVPPSNDYQQLSSSLSESELVSEVKSISDLIAPNQEGVAPIADPANKQLAGLDALSSLTPEQESLPPNICPLMSIVAMPVLGDGEEPSGVKQTEQELAQELTLEDIEALLNEEPVESKVLSSTLHQPAEKCEESAETSPCEPPIAEPAIWQSIKTQTVVISSPSSKSSGSPRKKKLVTTPVARKGTRRSTRTTRSSSVKPDDQFIEDVTISESFSTINMEPSQGTSIPVVLEGLQPPIQPSESVEISHEEGCSSSSAKNTMSLESNGLLGIVSSETSDAPDEQPCQIVEETESVEAIIPAQEIVHIITSSGDDSSFVETCKDKEYDGVSNSQAPVNAVPEDVEPSTTKVQAAEDSASPTKRTISSVARSDIGDPEQSTVDLGCLSSQQCSDNSSDIHSPMQVSPSSIDDLTLSISEDQTVDSFDEAEPINDADQTLSTATFNLSESIPELSTPDPTTSDLVNTISENAPSLTYDHDDTDMLRNFLSRVKANKAAKASVISPKRKRSLPHSPLQIPLGQIDNEASPVPTQLDDEFDVGVHTNITSPSKRRKRNLAMAEEDDTAPKSIRRSGRTRLPVLKSPVAAPSFIPVRRLGQDGDATVTLRRSEDKELATLTRINTRKNKAGALSAPDLLKKKGDEKDDPALRQRLLKEVFNDKNQKGKKKQTKNVAWATEIAQYQEFDTAKGMKEKIVNQKGKISRVDKKVEFSAEKATKHVKENTEEALDKKSSLRVRSKIALGMAPNGTPAPKRRTRDRA